MYVGHNIIIVLVKKIYDYSHKHLEHSKYLSKGGYAGIECGYKATTIHIK